MNSPRRAAEKKVVVRQEYTDASRGLVGSNLAAMATMTTTIKGQHFDFLDEGGARLAALSRAAFSSGGFIFQGAP